MKSKIVFLVITSFFVVFLDQITKFFVQHYLPYSKPVEVISTFFRITFIYNPGTAFGLNFGNNFPYTIVALAITLFVMYLAVKENKKISFFAYSLIIGGAIGNIIDRIRLGMVIDFIDIGINESLRWFVFNLADSFVTIGIILLLIDSVLTKSQLPHEIKG
jgi:signal peptidase II